MLLLARSLVLVLASCRLSSSYQATTYTLRILASTSSTRSNRHFKLSSNANMFGGSPDPSKEVKKPMSKSTEEQTDAYKSKAAKLRQEAAEMEVALREEARAKGLSEEMINKLVPIRAQGKPVASEALMKAPAEAKSVAMSTEEVRSKLGFLNSGDAVRFTSEMDRLQVKGIVALWNSKDMSKLSKADFVVSNAQLKTKTKIDSVKLKLDDVGFAYQNGLVIAIAFGTVFGVASSFIGGQIGFLLGYASALFPILLVGVGSIAPAAIGDVLRRVNHLTNAEAKDKYFLQNGYACGLPVSTFSSNGLTNECEFFQLRPDPAQSKPDNKLMFSKSFDQLSISRCVMTCLASNVAECIVYGEATGTTPADVGLLYKVLNAVEPTMRPDEAQNYIRWAAVNTHDLLQANRPALDKLVEFFRSGAGLEDCIAAIEARKSAK